MQEQLVFWKFRRICKKTSIVEMEAHYTLSKTTSFCGNYVEDTRNYYVHANLHLTTKNNIAVDFC